MQNIVALKISIRPLPLTGLIEGINDRVFFLNLKLTYGKLGRDGLHRLVLGMLQGGIELRKQVGL